jgi:hypothetical protein
VNIIKRKNFQTYKVTNTKGIAQLVKKIKTQSASKDPKNKKIIKKEKTRTFKIKLMIFGSKNQRDQRPSTYERS